MKKIVLCLCMIRGIAVAAQQDSLFNSPEKAEEKKPVTIFNSQKAINANTTEMVGKGKMEFKVMHNFGDIGGDFGGIKNFFGFDNATDVKIAFEIGLGKKLDLLLARARGTDGGRQQKLWELGLKYLLMQQLENDPSHPLSVALFANAVVASDKAATVPNLDDSYKDFSDRLSNTYQLIIAKKIGKVSLQLNPTVVTRGYSISYDQKTFFALGGALRFPLTRNMNFIVDYFHPFRKQATKDAFAAQSTPVKFYDPLGVGFEIITAGHIFHLNFTNATELLENRFIPRTTTSWGKGQFRWGFTIARKFSLWREKNK
ncbi:MAG TPA: DUF5777 family beta-barrel protein [Chitinophagaceae bacterium]